MRLWWMRLPEAGNRTWKIARYAASPTFCTLRGRVTGSSSAQNWKVDIAPAEMVAVAG